MLGKSNDMLVTMIIIGLNFFQRGAAIDHTQPADRGPLSPTLTGRLICWSLIQSLLTPVFTVTFVPVSIADPVFNETGSSNGKYLHNTNM